MLKKIFTLLLLSFQYFMFSQTTTEEKKEEHHNPEIITFISVLHPIATITSPETHYNFKDYYVIAFPVGINFWATHNRGFSFEIVPAIKTENGLSKASNITFHPGFLGRINKNTTYTIRAGFETSGRYGITPVLTKILARQDGLSYFASATFPVRTGNNLPLSLAPGILLGIAF